MRLFVAVLLPEGHKVALRPYRQLYQDKNIRFIPEENLHLTLHFIGEAPDVSLALLEEKLRGVAAGFPPFTLTFQEVAPGPKPGSPRLVWVRFTAHPVFAALSTALCQALDAAPGSYGKFIPHITIARLRKAGESVAALPRLQEPVIPQLEVGGFALWQSKLQNPHPAYSILSEFRLSGDLTSRIT